MPALVVSTFGAAASLAFNPFTIPSNPCFARLFWVTVLKMGSKGQKQVVNEENE